MPCDSNGPLKTSTKGAGRTCGEEVETTWSSTSALTPSVREMAPGARHDMLNDHWNGWNFSKIIGFRMFFSYLIFIINLIQLLLNRYSIFEAFPGGSVDE